MESALTTNHEMELNMDFIVKDNDIQAMIDAANVNGGGRVVVPPGVYPQHGSLFLKSNVELHLEPGSKIVGSANHGDYTDFLPDQLLAGDHPINKFSRLCFIGADHAENISITGTGEINGCGPRFFSEMEHGFFKKPPFHRPRMLIFVGCKNVRLEGVSFVDSPGWSFWLVECEEMFIRNIRISGDRRMINNDGIHLDSCRRVMISDCYIQTGDDSIILRAIRKEPNHEREYILEDVAITNCILESACQCVRVGCPCDGIIRNCTISNVTMRGNNGININNPTSYMRPGMQGVWMDSLLFENISIDVSGHPIQINVSPGIVLRKLGGITFTNIRLKGGGPCRFDGCGETIIEDVVLINAVCDKMPIAHHCRNIRFDNLILDDRG